MKKQITKQQFLLDVAKEIQALKKNATTKEIAELDLDSLHPVSKHDCIYGQMTGSCNSPRAIKLILKCCPRYTYESSNGLNYSEIKKYVNGKTPIDSAGKKIKSPNDLGDVRKRGLGLGIYSAIETYIMLNGAKNKNVINFLKSKTNKLIL